MSEHTIISLKIIIIDFVALYGKIKKNLGVGSKMGKQKTIRDVAELAGVSVATASRVLNDTDYPVRQHLKQRVRDAAEKLNYSPNAVARSLRQDTCKDIGLIVPNISNPFYLQAIHGIEDALRTSDYNIILCNTMHDPGREKAFLKQLYERQVKGVILSSVCEVNADIVQMHSKRGMKFVLLDQMLAGVETMCINFDSRAGSRMATEYLIQQGHQKIAFATTPMIRWTRKEMYKGYQDALLTAGIPLDDTLIFEHSQNQAMTSEGDELNIGRTIADSFIRRGCPATAILCVNDMVAIGCIQALDRHGIHVPVDVSVVGFDDIPFAEAYLPALTTIHYPAQEIGRLAAIMLVDSIQNNTPKQSLAMNLTPRLVIRDTVSPIRKTHIF